MLVFKSPGFISIAGWFSVLSGSRPSMPKSWATMRAPRSQSIRFKDAELEILAAADKTKVVSVVSYEVCPDLAGAQSDENVVKESGKLGPPASVFDFDSRNDL